MGNSVSRPSCLGEKGRKSEEFLKEHYLKKESLLDTANPSGRNNSEAKNGPPDKSPSPVVIENGWNLSPGSAKCQQNCPLPKQNNIEPKVQNGTMNCAVRNDKPDPAGIVWTPQREIIQRNSGSSWSWKPFTTREVTEVTEVTETIVTEIVEVTEYPSGEKGGKPIITRTVKVLTECAGELAEVNNFQLSITYLAVWLVDVMQVMKMFMVIVMEMVHVGWQCVIKKDDMMEMWIGVDGAGGCGREMRIVVEMLTGDGIGGYGGDEVGSGRDVGSDGDVVGGDEGGAMMGMELVRSITLAEETPSTHQTQDTLEIILSWVSDMEDLIANQKSPSSEVKVVKAQLQEQKLLQRLLEERSSRVECVLRDAQALTRSSDEADGEEESAGLSSLRVRWEALIQRAEARSGCLQQILPTAQAFHESLDAFQDWLGTAERHLAELWQAESSLSRIQEAHQQIQVLCRDIRLKSVELERVLENGQRVLELVSGKALAIKGHFCQPSRPAAKRLRSSLAKGSGDLFRRLAEGPGGSDDLDLDDLEDGLGVGPGGGVDQDDPTDFTVGVDQADSEEDPITEGDELRVVRLFRKEELRPLIFHDWKELSVKVVQEELDNEEVDLMLVGLRGPLKAFPLPKRIKKLVNQEWDVPEARPKVARAVAQWYPLMEDVLQLLILLKVEASFSAVTNKSTILFEQVVETEHAQLSMIDDRLEDLSHFRLEPAFLHAQLCDQKILAVEILQHRGIIEHLLRVSDVLLSLCPQIIQERLQPLLVSLGERAPQVFLKSSSCMMCLQHAQTLLSQFSEAHDELVPWLEETQTLTTQLSPTSISYGSFKQQQEVLQQLREAIAEHKPVVMKLQRISSQLVELSPDGGARFQRQSQEAEERYAGVRERVRLVAAVLEDAVPRFSQLTERMDLMVECIDRLQDRFQNLPAIRGESARIREQIRDNTLVLGELEKLGVSLETIRRQAEELLTNTQAASTEPTAKGIQDRMEKLLGQWRSLQSQAEERECWLKSLLTLADRFWHGLSELSVNLNETQQIILDMEETGSDPESIKARLNTMQGLREEVDSLQNDLDTLGILGVELMSSCGDMDKPNVTKSLDDLYATWHSLNKVWNQHYKKLEERLQASLRYQEAMQRLFDWLDTAEARLSEEFLVGGDLEMVKRQLSDLKEFKRELYQHKVELESLHHHTAPVKPEDKEATAQLEDFRHRWDRLEEEVVDRQHQLEAALLGLGQFQNQLEEQLQWLSHAADQLQGQRMVSIDLQSCEIELAKHKVLRNDVMSHARTVASVSEVGQGLLQASLGDNAEVAAGQLAADESAMGVCPKSNGEEATGAGERPQPGEVQDVTLEITQLLQWLENVELRLSFSKPAWGHPETTKEKLSLHLELWKEMESKQHGYNSARDRLQRLLASCHFPRGSSTEHSLHVLEQKWESIYTQVQDRKVCLTEGLTATTEFHSSGQELLKWISRTEDALITLPAASLVLETVTNQIQEHKVLQSEVNARGEKLTSLEQAACRLKDYSSKQDCAVIQNLVLTAQERLAKIQQRTVERARALEESRKRAKQRMGYPRGFTEGQSSFLELIKVPKVDSAVSAVTKRTTIPVTGGAALRDTQDRKLEVFLKRVFEVSGLGMRAVMCSSLAQRASLRWVQQLLTSQDLPPEEAAQADRLEAAIAYGVDALYDLFRVLARSMVSVLAARRLLWLRNWAADTSSKSSLGSLPFRGMFLFGDDLDQIIKSLGENAVHRLPEDRHRPSKTFASARTRARAQRRYRGYRQAGSRTLPPDRSLGRAPSWPPACVGRGEFSESQRLLLDWMEEVEMTLEKHVDSSLSQEDIKQQLSEHKHQLEAALLGLGQFQNQFRGAAAVVVACC
ncbi:dystonin-like [Rhinatrema bivittatum]|uniref:dystonin-like n=1 Tax=Rhinatrema bivittatum TaxID=194408 RepID=UPI00112AA5CF|nr:dystonin-like [Rhinatrema bivittatum]